MSTERTSSTAADVVVITGAGGMGAAAARRVGAGATVLLADVDERKLDGQVAALTGSGYRVVGHVVDVSEKVSVEELAIAAQAHGRIVAVVHTAGVSPVQAPADAILRVDLLGTARMLDAFGGVIAPGGAGVFIASMAGTMGSLDRDLEQRLTTTPTDRLLELRELSPGAIADPGTAYMISKRANQLRVRHASLRWGARGARVNSISPGVIATEMGAAELDGPSGEIMRAMVAGSGLGRIGTPEEIAAAVGFLLGRDASFITGTDLLVDGGVVASLGTAGS
jgi:NAD(P)-dependent dehydrogenase (short-subunit alcohol dehydrogenase family)